LGAVLYRFPSRKLIVIGVTGTNGKSSTVQFIAQLLTALGHRVGYTTTAGFMIAGEEIENRMKMTMPGRLLLQKLLRQMVQEKCTYAIIETSSQGILQGRHRMIDYDVAVFTNLTPEHIEAHGGFEPYKAAKAELWKRLMQSKRKSPQGTKIPKMSVININDEHGAFFAALPADRTILYGFSGHSETDKLVAKVGESGDFWVDGVKMPILVTALFQKKNALSAIATVHALGVSLRDIAAVATAIVPVAGRFERVDLGQPFTVVVDYAYEPHALKALYESAKALAPARIIGVHGSAGGGRDVARRKQIGELAAKEEDIVFVTNEDPYDEDPRRIIEDVAKGAYNSGMKDGENLFLIDDRREAIQKAVDLAKEGDCVLITGKGNEPVMAVANGKKIPWSDAMEVTEALQQKGYGRS